MTSLFGGTAFGCICLGLCDLDYRRERRSYERYARLESFLELVAVDARSPDVPEFEISRNKLSIEVSPAAYPPL